MEKFEKFENQLLGSYESILAVEGKKLGKEIDSLYKEDHELLIEKAKAYCRFYTDPKRVNIGEKMFKRCKNFISESNRIIYLKIERKV